MRLSASGLFEVFHLDQSLRYRRGCEHIFYRMIIIRVQRRASSDHLLSICSPLRSRLAVVERVTVLHKTFDSEKAWQALKMNKAQTER